VDTVRRLFFEGLSPAQVAGLERLAVAVLDRLAR
jgi:hypothetical protein